MSSSQRFYNLIQFGTLLALLVGVGLVIWELRQTREIVRVELASESRAQYSQRVQTMMGEESALAFARACDAPASLTTHDLVVLDHLHTEVLNNLYGPYAIERLASDLAAFDWRRWKGTYRQIFSTEFGRWWWEQRPIAPEVRREAEAFLAEEGMPDCKAFYDGYRTHVSGEPADADEGPAPSSMPRTR